MKIPNFNKPKFKRNDIAYLRLEINGKIEYKIDKPIILKTKEKVKRIIDDNVRLLIFD